MTVPLSGGQGWTTQAVIGIITTVLATAIAVGTDRVLVAGDLAAMREQTMELSRRVMQLEKLEEASEEQLMKNEGRLDEFENRQKAVLRKIGPVPLESR